MKLFHVVIKEYSGYDCTGHCCSYFVTANTSDEATQFMRVADGDEHVLTKEVFLPNFKRLKKPRQIY